ncbi:hypothetical protein DSC45_15760 [Streptomyces sp. YIM 130001]|uniref:hypothetical protein n=1 Tax=Streptomyces sp. YIM 130001 TaxID=2259644 RepID=UPI000E65E067|nr:hypothetical protein [Streptomyces sp. YIM 130001]RII16043.1 hypothetical protein DSC45_15760 [Streptomyces sp. YIM 130001]
MGKDAEDAARTNSRKADSQGGIVCPACKRPVETAVRRRKVLGAFVPVWGPGPCRNEKCHAYVEGEPEPVRKIGRHSRKRPEKGT